MTAVKDEAGNSNINLMSLGGIVSITTTFLVSSPFRSFLIM